MTPEVIAQAVREAQKQADFLMVLRKNLLNDVVLTCELNALHLLLLNEKLGRMLEQIIQGSGFETITWDLWRGVLVQRLSEMWRLRGTVQVISERYYDHHSLLFPEIDSRFNEQVRDIQELAKHCNTCYRRFAGRTVIHSKSLLSSIRKQVLVEVGERVAIAKSTILEDFGESEAAWRVMAPYDLAMLERLRAAR